MVSLNGNAWKTNKHGARIIPAAEDLQQLEELLARERNSEPHSGKTRLIASLEARAKVLRYRKEQESNETQCD